jgi:hypothetical protein
MLQEIRTALARETIHDSDYDIPPRTFQGVEFVAVESGP